MTLNQVVTRGRGIKPARKLRSPALHNRPEMKGVCLKVGITKPKKPNSGERKIARVRLSSGKVITAYIPGEGRQDRVLENPGELLVQVTDLSLRRTQCAAAFSRHGQRRQSAGLPRCEIPLG